MPTVFATAADMWQLATPPDSLFQDQSLAPGTWSTILKIGAGTGTMTLLKESSPLFEFSVMVKCVVAGELVVYGVVNPGVVPQFVISLDGGATYSPPYLPNDNGTVKFIRGGFTLQFLNNTAPSFLVGDMFAFTTTASPDVVRFLSAASAQVESVIRNTYQPPYASWGDDVRLRVCELARWYLLKKRGIDKDQDFEVYKPTETMKWLDDVAKGYIQPSIVQVNRDKLYPDVIVVRKPFRTSWIY